MYEGQHWYNSQHSAMLQSTVIYNSQQYYLMVNRTI